MAALSTRTHGFADYAVGLLLIVAPYLFGFADGGPAQWVPMALGAILIGYSLLTDYELGAVHLIPMPVHLGLDIGGGALLFFSPWLFGFADVIVWPHVLVGLVEICTASITRRHPAPRTVKA